MLEPNFSAAPYEDNLTRPWIALDFCQQLMQPATTEMATTPFNHERLTLEVSSKEPPRLLFKKNGNT